MAADFGLELKGELHMDASAAKSLATRRGHGKAKHISRCYLWIQQRIQSNDFTVHRVRTDDNEADLGTKYQAMASSSWEIPAGGGESQMGSIDEETRASAEEPRTPPTPESSMDRHAGIPGPCWTLELLTEQDAWNIHRALRHADADFDAIARHGRQLLIHMCDHQIENGREYLRWCETVIGEDPSPLQILIGYQTLLTEWPLRQWHQHLLEHLRV